MAQNVMGNYHGHDRENGARGNARGPHPRAERGAHRHHISKAGWLWLALTLLFGGAIVYAIMCLFPSEGPGVPPLVGEVKYTVTFDARGGSSVSPQRIDKDQCASLEDARTAKVGFEFYGWYVSADDAAGLDDTALTAAEREAIHASHYNFQTKVTEDFKLYAGWIRGSYAVSFRANGPSGVTPMDDLTFEYDEEKALTTNSYVWAGHTFAGWNTERNGSGAFYANGAAVKNLNVSMVGGKEVFKNPVILYAQWTEQQYTITYAGMTGAENDPRNPSGYTVNSVPVALYDPSRPGYTFVKWTDADGNTVTSITAPPAAGADGVTVTANWTAAVVNLTLKYRNDSTADGSIQATYGAAVALPASASVSAPDAAYTFAGWYMEDETGSFPIYDGNNAEDVEHLAVSGANGAVSAWNFSYTSVTLYARYLGLDDLAWSGITSGEYAGGYKVAKGAFAGTTLVLPERYEGRPVAVIGYQAFRNYSSLSGGLTLPTSLREIEPAAFEKCGLSGELTLPTGLVTCYWDTFRYNDGLTSVIIPATVKTFGNGMFVFTNGSTYPSAVKWYYNPDVSTSAYLKECVTQVVLPAGITEIPGYAFKDFEKLTSINTEALASVTSIGLNAFYGCTVLNFGSLSLANVTSIGANAFYKCMLLTGVTLSESLSSIGDYAFDYAGLTSVVVPAGVTSIGIGKGAFGRTPLTSAVIRCNPAVIPEELFYNCSSLQTVTIPASVATVNNRAFEGCTVLAKVFYGGANAAAWADISINAAGNAALTAAGVTRYYYSETESAVFGNFWKWTAGAPEIWTQTAISLSAALRNDGSLTATSGAASALVTADGRFSISVPADRAYATYPFDGWFSASPAAGGVRLTDKLGNKYGTATAPTSGQTVYARYLGLDDMAWTLSADKYSVGAGGLNANGMLDGYLHIPDKYEGKDVVKVENFQSTSYIKSLYIGVNVLETGGYAFVNCGSLTSVTFAPNCALVTLADGTFQMCSKLASVVLPLSLKTIGSYVFQNNSTLTSASFESGGAPALESVGTNAFQGTGLQSFTLPASLKTIGDEAFKSLASWSDANFVLPASLTSIGSSAFDGCKLLSGVLNIPTGVTSIGNRCFAETGLTGLVVPAASGLESIPGNAFIYAKLSSAVILKAVSIGRLAFAESPTQLLTSVVLADGVTFQSNATGSMGAFLGCTNLTAVYSLSTTAPAYAAGGYLPAGATLYLYSAAAPAAPGNFWHWQGDDASTLTPVPHAAALVLTLNYRDEGSLSEASLPAETYASAGGTAVLPDMSAINLYGAYSFGGWYLGGKKGAEGAAEFTASTVYNGPGGGQLYAYWNVLDDFTWETVASGTHAGTLSVRKGSAQTTATGLLYIPSKYDGAAVTTVSGTNNGFSSMGTTSLVLQEGVKVIEGGAFQATLLQSVLIPASVTSIGTRAFNSNGTYLTTVTFAADSLLATIGDAAFNYVPITSVSIPAGVTSIGAGAFQSCAQLTTVSFAPSVSSLTIGNNAFQSCSAITSMTLPAGLTSIGDYAFNSCAEWAVADFALPASVTNVGRNAFDGCKKLTGVFTMPAGITWGTNVFDGCIGFTGAVVSNASITTVPEGMFASCAGITSITLTSPLTSIGKSAFSGTGITGITVPAGVTVIPDSLFHKCKSLTMAGLNFLGTITQIKDNAFRECDAFTGVFDLTRLFPSVTVMSREMLCDCTNLTGVVLPASVTIEQGVFHGCTSLASVFYSGADAAAYSGNVTVSELTSGSNNTPYVNATRYYYSATSGADDGGPYWHYVDGAPAVWAA